MELNNLALKSEAFEAACRRERTTWKSWPENYYYFFLILYAFPMNLSPLELSERYVWMLEHLPLNWRMHFPAGLWKILAFLNVFDVFFRKPKHLFPTWKLWVENFHFGAKSQNFLVILVTMNPMLCVCLCWGRHFLSYAVVFPLYKLVRESSINIFFCLYWLPICYYIKKLD